MFKTTDLLQRNDKFVTLRNEFSNIPPSTSVHLATRVRRSRVVHLSWNSRFFIRAAPSTVRAINSSPVFTFLCKLRPLTKPTKQKCIGVMRIDSNTNFRFYWPCTIVYQYNETDVMHFSFNFFENQGSLHVSSITCSSSGDAAQKEFGILLAYTRNVSWLWYGCILEHIRLGKNFIFYKSKNRGNVCVRM
jgi:hypothetical protein